MAFFDTTWYTNYGDGSTTGYYAVPVWTTLTAYTAGQWVRQAAAPAVGSERCFVCVVAGTSLVSEPTWTVTRGAKTAEAAGPTWQECTGMPGPCGDLTNSVVWLTVKNQAITLGEVIYDSTSGSLQICSTAGTAGNGAQPSFSATAGTTTADNTITWTSLGPTSNYTTSFKYPHNRLANSFATNWGAASNQFAVASNHAETRAGSITLNCPGTVGTQNAIYCISSSTTLASPTLATSATISTTGANAINISTTGSTNSGYFYGIQFQAGDAANSASINVLSQGNAAIANYFENCVFKLTNTATSAGINLCPDPGHAGSAYLNLVNCSYLFGSASQSIFMSMGRISIVGGSAASSGSVPTTLFRLAGSWGSQQFSIRDLDMSNITGTLFSQSGTFQAGCNIIFANCKLGAGITLSTGNNGSVGVGNINMQVHDCDSTSTNYRYFYGVFLGTVVQETSIVRTGSLATDGTTTLSWNMTSGSNARFLQPFISEEVGQWNDITGSGKTATLYLISNTTLNNNDFWAELEYLGTSSFPLGVSTSSRMIPLATPTALTSDSSTWGGSTNKYKIVLSFTAQLKGPVKVRFYLAKSSATVYVDPYIYVS